MHRLYPPNEPSATPVGATTPADTAVDGQHNDGDGSGTASEPTTESARVDPWTEIGVEDRSAPPGRPWLMTNMVTSADGATAINGVSGALGGSGDLQVFRGLRGVADFVLAGASTVRQERYKPVTHPDAIAEQRNARGQKARARLAVITGSADLEPDLPMFGDSENRPVILTAESADQDRLRALEPLADVIVGPGQAVDPQWALAQLALLGGGVVLCEGGPSINGQFVAAGLVDEWNLTIAPMVAANESKRAAVGPLAEGPPPSMALRRVWVDDDHYLFCRWTRR